MVLFEENMKFVLIEDFPRAYEARDVADKPLGQVRREYRHVHKAIKSRGLVSHTAVPVWVFYEPNGIRHEPSSTRVGALATPVYRGDE